MRQESIRSLTMWGGVFGLVLLGCRIGDMVARVQATSTLEAAAIVPRPTFTRALPTDPPPLPTAAAAPTSRPVPPTPRPAPRPVPTRTVARPPTAPPPPPPLHPTADPYQGYYYRISKNVCNSSSNTRAEGTVYVNGAPQNGVKVRIANANGGDPVIDDFVSGVDPSDYKHQDPALAGKYRLGIAEGQMIDGNWWVFVVGNAGEQMSPGAYFKTYDVSGCNTATIDFAHN